MIQEKVEVTIEGRQFEVDGAVQCGRLREIYTITDIERGCQVNRKSFVWHVAENHLRILIAGEIIRKRSALVLSRPFYTKKQSI